MKTTRSTAETSRPGQTTEKKATGADSRLITHAKEAWSLVLSRWKLTIAGTVVDILFFFLFSWASTWAFITMEGPLNKIYDLAGENISKLAVDMNNPEGLSALLSSQQEFMAAYSVVISTALKFIGIVLALWLVLQGLSWAISHNIAGNRISGKEQASVYAWTKRFGMVTIPAAILAVGILYLSIRLAAWANINRMGDGAQTGISVIIALMFFTLTYFIFCGYASNPLAGQGATMETSLRRWRTMVPAYLAILLIVYASNFLLSLLMQWSAGLGLLFGILVVAPSYTYNRVLMILCAKHHCTALPVSKSR
ncbi:MAG: hypothetical protein AABX47_00065 [Nanoarchaeota archaeon]